MKKRGFLMARRFFRRFNPWLFLVCLLLAAIIWCATMYMEDPDNLRATLALLSDSYTV